MVAIVAGLLFLLVLKVSLAGVLRGPYPGAALDWSSRDAAARANLSALILSRDRSPGALAQAQALAEDALRRDATQVAALRSLAFISDERGDEAEALRRIAMAQRLSRRDFQTQSWIIRYYSGTGNSAALVRHFDIALRTTERNRRTLLPLLVGATLDPDIVAPLRAKLLQSPPWLRDFLAHLVDRAPSPRNAVALSQGLLDPTIPEQRTFAQTLIGSLVSRGEYALALDVYRGMERSEPAVAPLLRNGDFEAAQGFWPFDWSLSQETDLFAARDRRPDGNGSVLRLTAFNGRTGVPARQLLRLPAGAYRVGMTSGDVPPAAFDRPTLQILCAGAGTQPTFITLRPDESGPAPKRTTGRFSIPSDCGWQWLFLRIAGDGAQPEASPWIDDIVIERTSGAAAAPPRDI